MGRNEDEADDDEYHRAADDPNPVGAKAGDVEAAALERPRGRFLTRAAGFCLAVACSCVPAPKVHWPEPSIPNETAFCGGLALWNRLRSTSGL
jgi:hypothetical protein